VAAVTGASSGIGAATAVALAAAGFETFAGARRAQRIPKAERVNALELDVTRPGSIDAFVDRVNTDAGRLDVLVNNAGIALGRDAVAVANDEDWRRMWETNLLGAMRMTRSFLPLLRSSEGHIVNIGSVSAFEVYPGGAGYNSTKWAVRALTLTLRLELNGEPIRVTEVDPGLTETEFSVVRFKGDEARARKVYENTRALRGEDIAECIVFAVTRPKNVNVDELVVRSIGEATAYLMDRKPRWSLD
jgi:NADP-dependent 3-hydroxy acid dehydrogenase YdfG